MRTPRIAIFARSHNYVYDTAIGGTRDVPYGTKGFVVMRKGGDGAVFKAGQAMTPVGQIDSISGHRGL